MKKLFDLLLIAAMLLTLFTGCTSTPTEQPQPATEAPVLESTEPSVETEAPVSEPTEPSAASEAPVSGATQPPAEESTEPKVFTYIMTKEPISLDASKSNDSMSAEVLFHLSEGLVRSYDGQIIPGIAESWEISEDGLAYTFHLRDSVWEDGEPVTAQQFEYSFKRFLSPETAAAFADSLYPVVNAKEFNTGVISDSAQLGVKATDDKTFVINLVNPTPYFLSTLGANEYFYPLRQDFVEKFGDSYAANESSFLSNGPFTLKKWEHEASLTLAKNPNYWNVEAIKLDEIVQLIVADSNTAVSMYDNGEVDYIPELSPEYTVNYPDAKVGLTGSDQFLEFNLKGTTSEAGELVSNLNFRKALSYVIDRQSIAAAVAGTGTIAANRFTGPEIYGSADTFANEYPITEGVVPPTGDPEKAKEYLAKALEELGTTVDKLPKLTYVVMESKKHKLYAEAFLDSWTNILGLTNIEITILPVPQAIQAGMEGKFDIYLQGMSADPDPYGMLAYWVVDGGVNWTGWNDQEYTDKINSTNSMLDPVERFTTLLECEKYLIANGPLEPLFFPGTAYIYRDYVSNLVKSSIGAASQLIYVDINK